MNLKNYIRTIEDFPKKGILFRDITPLILNDKAFNETINQMSEYALKVNADIVMAPEARGFIFGCPVAAKLELGFVPVRKPGKLPGETISTSYTLEYGENSLSIHSDSIKPGQRVLIVDDLLATGGTTKATIDLVEKLGGVVAGICCLIELEDLNGRSLIEDYDVHVLLKY